MGFGSPPREERIRTQRAILFFVAMLALWTGVEGLIFGSLVALFALFGYPMTAVIALLEYLSSRITTGIAARLLFLLFAAGALLAFWYFTKREVYDVVVPINIVTIGPGSIAVVLGYFIRGLWRDAVAEEPRAA